MTTALPSEVVEQDKQLDAEIARKTDELMKLRWHWTLDESNPDRVTVAAYARAVGRDRKTISRDANAWVRWLADQSKRANMGPSAPAHPDSWRLPAACKLSDEREQVVRAVARANNKKFSNVAVNMRKEVNEALTEAQDRAERNGTTVEDEITEAAEFLAKNRTEWERASARAKSEAEKAISAKLSEHGKAYWAGKRAVDARCRPEFLAVRKGIDQAVLKLQRAHYDATTVRLTKHEARAIRESLDRLLFLVDQVKLRIVTDADGATEIQELDQQEQR